MFLNENINNGSFKGEPSELLEISLEAVEEYNNIVTATIMTEHVALVKGNNYLMDDAEVGFFAKVKEWFVKFGMKIANWFKAMVLKLRAWLSAKLEATAEQITLARRVTNDQLKAAKVTISAAAKKSINAKMEVPELIKELPREQKNVQYFKDLFKDLPYYGKKEKPNTVEKGTTMTKSDIDRAIGALPEARTILDNLKTEVGTMQDVVKIGIKLADSIKNGGNAADAKILISNCKTYLIVANSVVNAYLSAAISKANYASSVIGVAARVGKKATNGTNGNTKLLSASGSVFESILNTL